MSASGDGPTTLASGWGTAPWAIVAERSTLPPPHRCDALVIGAGLAGLSTAYHLAQRGVRVTVLEAAAVGAGASGRTGGLVLEGTAAGPLEQVDHCLDAIAAVAADAAIACDLDLRGCWEVRHQREASGRLPGWRDGDARIVVAATQPGGTVDPGKLLSGLFRAARRAGASIHLDTPAQELAPSRRGAQRVRCASGGEIQADRVMIALNAYTTQLLELPVPLHSALTLALCTAPLDVALLDAIGLAERKPFYTLDLPYLWGRCLPDRRLIFGAGLVFPSDGDVRSVAIGQPEAAASMAHLESRVRDLHPALAEVEVTHRWGGPIAFLAGRAPVLSRLPDAPGVIVTGGCAGHGVALSVRIGQLIAAAVVDGAPLPPWGALPT